MIKNILYATSLQRKESRRALFWEMLHSTLVVAPSGFMLIIILELFSPAPNATKLWVIVAAMLGMMILQFWIARRAMLASNTATFGISYQMRILLGTRIQQISLGLFKKRDSNDVASVILQDVANFENIFVHSIGNIASAVFGSCILSIILIVYDWRLAGWLLLAIVLVVPFIAISNFLVSHYGKPQIKARNATCATFLEYIHGIRYLKSFGLTGEKFVQLDRSLDDFRRESIKLEAIPSPFIVIAGIVFELAFFNMIAWGVYWYNNQMLSMPVLITFLILGYNLYQPLKVLMIDYILLRYMNISLSRISEIMSIPVLTSMDNKIPTTFNISFEQVTFGYQDEPTIKDVTLHVPEHSMLALVGASGSGKTTLLSLLARFWDVQHGSISIGGINIRSIHKDKFYTLISEVFQDVHLFNDTIYNNIKIGNPNADQTQVLDALRKAECLEFVEKLPHKWDTIIGENGSKLSSGQKQRLSIARAFLKDAPIILLDEATASLDSENELYIQNAIQELIKNKTVIAIAHKLATVQYAAQIAVLERGQIAELGTHTQLLARNGIYAKMWNLQQQANGWKFAKQR